MPRGWLVSQLVEGRQAWPKRIRLLVWMVPVVLFIQALLPVASCSVKCIDREREGDTEKGSLLVLPLLDFFDSQREEMLLTLEGDCSGHWER